MYIFLDFRYIIVIFINKYVSNKIPYHSKLNITNFVEHAKNFSCKKFEQLVKMKYDRQDDDDNDDDMNTHDQILIACS